MSFLAPLYFLGGLAIVGPIVFHLIRRQPKGEVEFSSLMFLDATPPRLTRRSRLENWPLLLLRCAAILMLAFAFARPFLPLAESQSVEGVKQAVVLLVDQSASMRRNGVWEQANQKAQQVLDQVGDDTLISVIGFDALPQDVLSLQESTELTPEARKGAAKDAIKKLSPTWKTTDIGAAIRFAADQAALLEIGDAESDSSSPNNPNASAAIETRIVLLSDLQSGASIESLQGYEWPDRVWLDVQSLAATTRGNVSLRVLPQTAETESPETQTGNTADTVRVQVTHADDGDASTFRLRFEGQEKDASVVQVAPGKTRFFTLQLPAQRRPDESETSTATLVVSGDQDEFDNQFHFIRPKRVEQTVELFESPPDSNAREMEVRDTLSFYAKQLPWSDATRQVTCNVSAGGVIPDEIDPKTVPLLILNPSDSLRSGSETLKRYLDSGGRVLVVLDRPADDDSVAVLADLLEAPDLAIDEEEVDDYALISSVDFKSALIAPLSDPGVNDFSNIRVWNHRTVSGFGDESKVTLKLDNGAPLLLTKEFSGEDSNQPAGLLWLFSTGWQPAESQFALSTKFVPILLGMLGPNRQLAPDSLMVGDKIPAAEDSEDLESEIAEEPGIFVTDSGSTIAVNLNPSESETPAIDVDRLSQFGAVVSSPANREQELKAERALRDVEIEARQGWWQWLVLATLGLIAAETVLAARSGFPTETES